MVQVRALVLGWLSLVAFTSTVSAFVDPPVLVPEHPVAGETVSVSIRSGVCDGFIVEPGYPQITRDGNSIRILLAATHASNSSWCNVPIGTAIFLVGSFSPGTYTLQVDRIYDDLISEDVVETLGVLPFTVGPTPSSVPTLDQFGVALLMFGMLSFAVLALRRRQP